MGGISPAQIIIVVAIILLVFGPSRLPGIARSVGRGIREFRGAVPNPSDLLGPGTPEPTTPPRAVPAAAVEEAPERSAQPPT